MKTDLLESNNRHTGHYENISIERMQNFILTCSHRSIHENKKTKKQKQNKTKGSVFKLNQAYYYYKCGHSSTQQ